MQADRLSFLQSYLCNQGFYSTSATIDDGLNQKSCARSSVRKSSSLEAARHDSNV